MSAMLLIKDCIPRTVAEVAVIVGDALRQVDVTTLTVALLVEESSTKNRD
jgi:hypothetical protein